MCFFGDGQSSSQNCVGYRLILYVWDGGDRPGKHLLTWRRHFCFNISLIRKRTTEKGSDGSIFFILRVEIRRTNPKANDLSLFCTIDKDTIQLISNWLFLRVPTFSLSFAKVNKSQTLCNFYNLNLKKKLKLTLKMKKIVHWIVQCLVWWHSWWWFWFHRLVNKNQELNAIW